MRAQLRCRIWFFTILGRSHHFKFGDFGGRMPRKDSGSGKDLPIATHGSDDRPLRIGSIEIPCYVLEDGLRVISQRGMKSSLGMNATGGARRMVGFIQTLGVNASKEHSLTSRMIEPIKFRMPSGVIAHGHEATLLADICDAVLEARREGRLHRSQQHIAEHCEILVRGFARVGIIALVDEATGYQADRARDALSKILEAFIAKELQPYVRTFPTEFYEEMFRLRGLDIRTDTVHRPQYFGLLTNDIVYSRLAPGVLDELKKINTRTKGGNLKNKHFQHLTSNLGYPRLREYLSSVITIMKLSRKWDDFQSKLNRIHPRYGSTMQLPFNDQDEGKGL